MKSLFVVAALLGIVTGAMLAAEQDGYDRALAGAFLRAQQNQPPEPYPGQREHKEPPEGWVCSREATDGPAHLCFCTGMQKNEKCPHDHEPADDPETEEDESQGPPPEDRDCASWCWRTHCHCKVMCDT